ncbi:MAG TPA: hypothetical protein VF950_20675 [Planctomycetota bacterium]
MRIKAAAAFLLLGLSLHADVLILKDKRVFTGKLVEKPSHWEVTTEGGLKTFLKEEVEKVVTSPKEYLGDADKRFEEAKAEFTKAVELKDLNEQSALLKAAIPKLTQAREAYAAARELFWEDKYAELDLKLVQIMQLMRLLRERVGSEIAKGPPTAAVPAPVAVAPPPPPTPAAVNALDEALATLIDPARRADAVRRAAARDAFRAGGHAFVGGSEVATAAAVFLSRPETPGLQDYFGKPWIKSKPGSPDQIQAAAFLAGQIKANPGAADVLLLFAAAHLSQSPAGPEAEKAARDAGILLKDGRAGTAEGLALRDIAGWLATGDFDLAALAYAREYKATSDTPAVRFLAAYATVRLAQAKKRGYTVAASAMEAVKPLDAPFRDHTLALGKSVRNVAVCSACSGEGKFRCTGCHGKKEVRDDCPKCRGTGAVGLTPCAGCRGRGFLKLARCSKCKDGFPECPSCDKKPRVPPELDDMFLAIPCGACAGRGTPFRNVAIPCRSCHGLGHKLTPRADPSKILPY